MTWSEALDRVSICGELCESRMREVSERFEEWKHAGSERNRAASQFKEGRRDQAASHTSASASTSNTSAFSRDDPKYPTI